MNIFYLVLFELYEGDFKIKDIFAYKNRTKRDAKYDELSADLPYIDTQRGYMVTHIEKFDKEK